MIKSIIVVFRTRVYITVYYSLHGATPACLPAKVVCEEMSRVQYIIILTWRGWLTHRKRLEYRDFTIFIYISQL